jgi:lipid-A-disaccharide synthase
VAPNAASSADVAAGAPLRIGIVAGEASGDQLGAELIDAVRRSEPHARFEGVAGPAMRAAGCIAIADSESLSVMGLVEVLGHLPSLLRLRGTLERRFLDDRVDVFVGIDSPDFNVGLEERLRARGVTTIQYVSPQFWAWRPGRVKHIAKAADLVLCLLPFEQPFYAEHGVAARYVGHPLADRIPERSPRAPARRALGLPEDAQVVALLPGSRASEVKRLGADFARCAAWLARERPGIRCVAAMANSGVRALFEQDVARAGAAVSLVDGRAQETIAAADVVLVASGTATLQTLLIKRPMVVAYRLATMTRWIMQGLGLLKIDRYAMPNLLAGRDVVPEIMQDAVTPEALGRAVLHELDTPGRESELITVFDAIHSELKRNASAQAAAALLELVEQRRGVA